MVSKKTAFIFMILIVIFLLRLNAKPISIEICKDVVYHKIDHYDPTQSYSIYDIHMQRDKNGDLLFYLVELYPRGFMIIAGDDELPPVMGYSFKNSIDAMDNSSKPFQIIKADISLRMQALEKLPE
ncbi:MAG TPA: hypothetical protein ENG70_04985, partial [Candidatus Cloacimonetes bacterium]|nr:hypothetical protein [Candidatus Cloacimonadota bacterium]HEX38192.1 hypothetical protein [Candidatus Cloacimonadota bacterium]